MLTQTPQPKRREEYRPPDFKVETVSLDVAIGLQTLVIADLELQRNAGAAPDAPLLLDGRHMELVEVSLNGETLSPDAYQLTSQSLCLPTVPDRFSLRVITRIDPESNTSLEGFYRSGPMLCTQCEAEGFSRITYFPDRPDVLSRYTVRLEADRQRYPLLLSNGEPRAQGLLDGGRHFAIWEDPFPKPCYLFAMVAADLACVEDRHVTPSGREVTLRFFVDHGNEARVPHAMASLKAAMRWDERVYGLEYDLSLYMVVACRDFNMGAMENKGLNLFNARFVLASPDTATDADFEGVESVIAHEYFHNWTGNRVTCRDWFQLSLKEGLTVFRDQSFSADMNSPAVQRIGDVRNLRTLQFAEDAGPMSHPVRPDAYVEVNNFYTATVYEKGAEIVRMIETTVGSDRFVEGVKHYLREHDGQAATIEDFLAAHETVSGQELAGFRRWYGQAGTPVVSVWDEYDLQSRSYRLHFRQITPPTADSADKLPVPIPISLRFFDPQGNMISLGASSPPMPREDLVLLEQGEAELVFENVPLMPTPSFLRGYSAPVRLQFGYSGDALVTLLLHEDDGFARWEAAQRLILNAFFELLAGGKPGADTALLCRAFQLLAAQPPEDRALLAELLRLPSESYLASQLQPLDAPRLTAARDRLRLQIAYALTGPFSVWVGSAPEEPGASNVGRRALSNVALWYLAATGSEHVLELCSHRAGSTNMTLAHGALLALNDFESDHREAAMAAFHLRWRHDALVLDKWFALQAASAVPGGAARVESLLRHPDYVASPNRIRSVLGTFWRENLRAYHQADGEGYRVLAEQVGALNATNPQLAARLCDGLLGWRNCVSPNDRLLKAALETLAAGSLSPDVREKVEKALN